MMMIENCCVLCKENSELAKAFNDAKAAYVELTNSAFSTPEFGETVYVADQDIMRRLDAFFDKPL